MSSSPRIRFCSSPRTASASRRTCPLPPDHLWILRPADRELTTAGELRMITETPVPFGWEGWHLQLASLEKVQLLVAAGLPDARRPGLHAPSPPAWRAAPGSDHALRLTRLRRTATAVAARYTRLSDPLARRHPARRGRHLPRFQGNRPSRDSRHLGRRTEAHPGSVRHHGARSAGPRDAQDDLHCRRRLGQLQACCACSHGERPGARPRRTSSPDRGGGEPSPP